MIDTTLYIGAVQYVYFDLDVVSPGAAIDVDTDAVQIAFSPTASSDGTDEMVWTAGELVTSGGETYARIKVSAEVAGGAVQLAVGGYKAYLELTSATETIIMVGEGGTVIVKER